ncbi:hypothetical protein RRG08_002933 [Elysia crispata]|uniref:Uncharacterized protein n=1 Tax=Elysia crispata TaxID=231223 RepID=A0AAE1E3J6_9GAST|nr:hypothetical protein RRG08_002933 [Elysia crispata]
MGGEKEKARVGEKRQVKYLSGLQLKQASGNNRHRCWYRVNLIKTVKITQCQDKLLLPPEVTSSLPLVTNGFVTQA